MWINFHCKILTVHIDWLSCILYIQWMSYLCLAWLAHMHMHNINIQLVQPQDMEVNINEIIFFLIKIIYFVWWSCLWFILSLDFTIMSLAYKHAYDRWWSTCDTTWSAWHIYSFQCRPWSFVQRLEKHCGLTGDVLRWMTSSFQTDRTQQVVYNSMSSVVQWVCYGVQQESVLGPHCCSSCTQLTWAPSLTIAHRK